MARTSSRLAARLKYGRHGRPAAHRKPQAARPPGSKVQELRRHESVADFYSPSGGHSVAHGGHHAGGVGGVPATSSLRPAGSRLSNHSGDDVLSGGKPGCDGVIGDRAIGAAIRPGTRPEPDDLDQFVWQFGHHAAIWTRSEY